MKHVSTPPFVVMRSWCPECFLNQLVSSHGLTCVAVFFIATAAVTTGRVFRKAMQPQQYIVIRRLPDKIPAPAGKKHL
jgi:hypothetical protein